MDFSNFADLIQAWATMRERSETFSRIKIMNTFGEKVMDQNARGCEKSNASPLDALP